MVRVSRRVDIWGYTKGRKIFPLFLNQRKGFKKEEREEGLPLKEGSIKKLLRG